MNPHIGKAPMLDTQRGSRGQAMTEFALTLVLLLLVFSGIVDLGRAFLTYLALYNAAGEGAYYASAFPARVDQSDQADPDNITFRTRNEVPGQLSQLVNWNNATVAVSYPASTLNPPEPEVGRPVKVTVTTPFRLIGPLPGLFGWNGQLTLRVDATQTVLTTRDD